MVKIVEDFDAEVKNSKGVVVVEFFATWCGPCKAIAPVMDELAKQYVNVKIVKVDVDELSEAAEEFEISAMPTFVVLKDGKEVERMLGADKGKLSDLVKKHNPA